MTQDEIIKMARQAGFFVATDEQTIKGYGEDLERFAKLVAAKEREKVARWQIGSGYTTGHGDTIEDLLVELEWQVREAEREACANVAEQYQDSFCGQAIAEEIRARGEA